jgi:predicted O-methyltransferase YrrM
MDAALQSLLAELEEQGNRNDATQTDYSHRMLNLDSATARVLALWVRSARRQSVLEVGTSNGYSTLWLAWAISSNGGKLTSVDRLAEKHALADANLRRAGLRDSVELATGDATEVVGRLPGPFDCVFFDADRFSIPGQLELLLPKLTTDVLLFSDNATTHPQELAGYFAALDALPDFEQTVVPVGKGLSVAYRSGALPQ